ncbi:MAG: cytochrome b5 domain-containing protein [Actinobacteria bacterium]|nr:cytochrome b5 domain-containing protein [Actinomycetota bacterium]
MKLAPAASPGALSRMALALAAVALPLAACSSPSAAPVAPTASVSAPATSASATPTPTPTPTPSASSPVPAPTATKAAGYTMADVRKHATASSCWSVVDGTVYDLTKWINRHPGGRARILDMCGKDATRAFTAEHGNQKRPNDILDGYKLGKLS